MKLTTVRTAAIAAATIATLALAACAPAGAPSASVEPTPAPVVSGSGAPTPPPSDLADFEIPAKLKFEATTLTGDPFDGVSLAGTNTILWFWASWCPTCNAEAPNIAAAIAELPEGVTIIGIPGRSDEAGMLEFVEQYGLDTIVHVVDADGTLWANFNVGSQPAFTFISADGRIRTIPGTLGKDGLLRAAADLVA